MAVWTAKSNGVYSARTGGVSAENDGMPAVCPLPISHQSIHTVKVVAGTRAIFIAPLLLQRYPAAAAAIAVATTSAVTLAANNRHLLLLSLLLCLVRRGNLQWLLALIPPPGGLPRSLPHTCPTNGSDVELQIRRPSRHFFQHGEASVNSNRTQRAKAKSNEIKYFVDLYTLLLGLRFGYKLWCLKSQRFKSGNI